MSFATWLPTQIAAAKLTRNNTNPTLPVNFEANITTEMEDLILSMVYVTLPTGPDRTAALGANFETDVLPYISDFQLDIFHQKLNAKMDFELGVDRHPAEAEPAPVITLINPATDLEAGGAAIAITGRNFQAGVAVTIGGNPATSVTRVSAYEITCNAPAGTAGDVDVVVTNPDNQSATEVDGFTYT